MSKTLVSNTNTCLRFVGFVFFFQLKAYFTPTLTVYIHNPYLLNICGNWKLVIQ